MSTIIQDGGTRLIKTIKNPFDHIDHGIHSIFMENRENGKFYVATLDWQRYDFHKKLGVAKDRIDISLIFDHQNAGEFFDAFEVKKLKYILGYTNYNYSTVRKMYEHINNLLYKKISKHWTDDVILEYAEKLEYPKIDVHSGNIGKMYSHSKWICFDPFTTSSIRYDTVDLGVIDD